MDVLLQQCINGLVLGGTHVLTALGLSLVFVVLDLTNFARREMLTVTGSLFLARARSYFFRRAKSRGPASARTITVA